jgi:hypothetical protein
VGMMVDCQSPIGEVFLMWLEHGIGSLISVIVLLACYRFLKKRQRI